MIKIFRHIRKSLLMEDKTGKYLKYAIGEIVLVVIGILIALQVNNWNETRVEQLRMTEYAKSLIQDLNNDLKMLNVSRIQAAANYQDIDSLKAYIQSTSIESLSNTHLFMLTNDLMYRPFKWNRSTFDELKNSGSLRYITNDSLKTKLIAYQTFSYHLDEDFEFDKSNVLKAAELLSEVLNLNSEYLSLLATANSENSSTISDMVETQEYKNAIANDLKLISYDKARIDKMVNTCIQIQNEYRIRGHNEMPAIIADANELIQILKNEYHL